LTQTVAAIAERALRRLGVAIVPVADRPALITEVPQATVATNALVELGVIASDESPSAADQALALEKVRAVQASLTAQALVWWTDDAVPYALVEEYTKLAALMMASSFGRSVDPALAALLEARIRRISLVLSAPDEATDAVMDTHRDLAARGLARWSSFDIPDAVAGAYAVLAADRLAPMYPSAGKQDPREMLAAERAIMRYVSLPSSGEHVRAEYF
jgi:hypothetical protein